MKYCTNCYKAVAFDDAEFCPYCGHPVKTASEIVEEDTMASIYANISKDEAIDVTPVVIEAEDIDEGCRVILVSCGRCTQKTAKEVICDLLGYTTATVTDLLAEVPVELADELNERQAVVLAQALAEYGIEVTVVDENNRYVDISTKASETVYTSSGDLTAAALAIISSLTAANRVHRYRRYRKPSLLELIFRPAYRAPAPVHVRRRVVREPENPRRITVKKRPLSTPKPAVRHESKPSGSIKPHGAKPQNTRPQSTKPQGGHHTGSAGSVPHAGQGHGGKH